MQSADGAVICHENIIGDFFKDKRDNSSIFRMYFSTGFLLFQLDVSRCSRDAVGNTTVSEWMAFDAMP